MTKAITIFLLSALSLATFASDPKTTSFTRDNASVAPIVLSHLTNKALVAEYIDSLESGIGQAYSHLIWREVFTAVSDQSGAGVILAVAPPGEAVTDMLEENYHTAAMEIAERQEARMLLWGEVFEVDGAVFVNNHLSLIESHQGNQVTLKAKISNRDRGDFSIPMDRSLFNFPGQQTSRSELFERGVIIDSDALLVAEPDNSSETLARLSKDQIVQGLDIIGEWYKVRLDNGIEGYIHMARVRLMRYLTLSKSAINVRSGPSTRDDVVANRDVKGRFAIYKTKRNNGYTWYQLKLDGRFVWIADTGDMNQVFSAPVVHFVAGLYRYFADNPGPALTEFKSFVDFPDVSQSNVNLSVAYQYLAINSLVKGSFANSQDYLAQASAQTPYDPMPAKLSAFGYLLMQNADYSQRQINRVESLELDSSALKTFEREINQFRE